MSQLLLPLVETLTQGRTWGSKKKLLSYEGGSRVWEKQRQRRTEMEGGGEESEEEAPISHRWLARLSPLRSPGEKEQLPRPPGPLRPLRPPPPPLRSRSPALPLHPAGGEVKIQWLHRPFTPKRNFKFIQIYSNFQSFARGHFLFGFFFFYRFFPPLDGGGVAAAGVDNQVSSTGSDESCQPS